MVLAVGGAALLALAVHAQQPGDSRRPLAERLAPELPDALFERNSAFVHELVLPVGAIKAADFPLPVTRVRYAAVPFFGFDRSELEGEAVETTKGIARALLQARDIQGIVIVGHTDSVGSLSYNTDLARKRALSVAKALVASGVDSKLLSIVPLGESYPIASNSSEDGRAQNRRVEFYISSVAAAAAAGPRTLESNEQYRNNHPECASNPGAPDCSKKQGPLFDVLDASGKPTGELDMSKHIVAVERPVRRPMIVEQRFRRALPVVTSKPN